MKSMTEIRRTNINKIIINIMERSRIIKIPLRRDFTRANGGLLFVRFVVSPFSLLSFFSVPFSSFLLFGIGFSVRHQISGEQNRLNCDRFDRRCIRNDKIRSKKKETMNKNVFNEIYCVITITSLSDFWCAVLFISRNRSNGIQFAIDFLFCFVFASLGIHNSFAAFSLFLPDVCFVPFSHLICLRRFIWCI